MIVLGVDPGKTGAAVLLRGREVVAVRRTAELVGSAKWQAAHAGVTGWLRSVHAEHRVDLAVLELYGGRAGEGRGSMLTIGVGWGLWLGALSALEIPVLTPSAASWTRQMFVGVAGEGKERSANVARGMLPDLDLTPGRCVKVQDGIADAGCLALWGQSTAIGRVA